MGQKRRCTNQLNWQATTSAPFNVNTQPSGVLVGVMTGTNTIYSNILDISNTDNQGLEITWTGTPTGTILVNCSESGTNFYPLTFEPALTQPTGTGGGYLVNLNQIPWRYIMVQYTNISGAGALTIWNGSKDVN